MICPCLCWRAAHLIELARGVPREALPPPLLYLFLLKVLPERLQLRLCGVASAALGGLVPFCDAVLGHVPHCHAEAGGDVEEECSPDCCADNHVDPGPPVDGAWVPRAAVFQLLAGKDQALLVWQDAHWVKPERCPTMHSTEAMSVPMCVCAHGTVSFEQQNVENVGLAHLVGTQRTHTLAWISFFASRLKQLLVLGLATLLQTTPTILSL